MNRSILIVALLLWPSLAGAQFFWLQFLPPVDEEADLPTCTDGSVEENRARFVRDSDLVTVGEQPSIYFCPDGGGAWIETAGAGGGAGSGDIEAVGDCTTGSCFQATTATHVFAAPAGGGVAAFRPLTDADIPNTITVDLATLATTATTANAGDSATAFFSAGAIEEARIDAALARDAEVAAGYQPLDADLTSIAAIVTTGFGRNLLALADQAALLSAAGAAAASHAHAASDVTSGALVHERGGLEADVSAFGGLIRIAAGSTSAVSSLAGLNTALGSSIADGAHTTDTDTTCLDAGVSCLFAASATEGGPATSALALADADFGDWSCLTGSCTLDADTVAPAEMADADHGDVAWSAGVATVQASTALSSEIDSDIAAHAGNASAHHTKTVDASELSTGTIPAARVGAAHVDAITEIAAGLKTGAATTLVTGTAGLTDECAKWNVDGDLVSAGAACGSGGGGVAMPAKVWEWSGPNLLPAQPADLVPPIGLTAGTSWDALTADFDSGTDECRSHTFQLPAELDTSGSATFRVVWTSASATTGSVVWDFRHIAVAEGETCDAALTTESAASDAVQGTTGLRTITTWTETLTNLGWAAGEQVCFLVCRDGDGTAGTDDMAGDAKMHAFSVAAPRAE